MEVAKKLKDLGVKQESLFYHVYRRNKNVDAKAWFVVSSDQIKEGTVWDSHKSEFARIEPLIEKQISAFTVAELGEMLPKECRSHKSYNPEVDVDKQ